MSGPVLKSCGCGQTYEADAWRALPYVGRMSDEEGGFLVLRNCTACGSTLAVDAFVDRLPITPLEAAS